jgi:DNA mismatch repair ATPase MutL
MAKQIIRLTESDVHKIIENAVNKIISEGWRDTYDKWSSSKDHKNLRLGREEGEEGEDLNKKWSEELKAEFPDKGKRRHEFNQYTKSKNSDSANKFEKEWKKSGGEEKFKKDYKKRFGVDAGDDVDESIVREAVRKSLMNLMNEDLKKKVNEAFEDDFNVAKERHLSKSPNSMFGFELKNPDGEWQYGDITFDPNTNRMSCMGVSIDVDPSLSIDQNLEGLYDELVSKGFGDEDFDEDGENDYIESKIDTEANYDDFPSDIH